jgi:spermidine synthase
MPALIILFVGSGCAALIYEIVWFQLLELVIGSSAVSLGFLLATFMGGLCVGSLALPRVVSPERHPLRVYAVLELATAFVGIFVLFAVPYVGGLYIASVGHGLPGLVLREAACALCLLPPTILMGATLPAVARVAGATAEGMSWVGFLYGANIAGSVLGSLLAGFYLLRVYDTAIATYVAAAINIGAGAAALFLARRRTDARRVLSEMAGSNRPAPAPARSASRSARASTKAGIGHDPRPVYLAIALSGAAALGAEVVWTRTLGLMLGATVYTFSIILAVFLIGLGMGSALGSQRVRRGVDPRLALVTCQLLLMVAVAWSAFVLAHWLPYWPASQVAASSPGLRFRIDLLRCLVASLPAACLWGASFPFALAATVAARDAATIVSRVYAANTVGAIAGALGFSLVVIPLAGSQQAERLLIALSAAGAVVLLMPLENYRLAVAAAGSIVAAWLLALTVPAVPALLVAYGRAVMTSGTPAILYLGEGINASIAVTESASGTRNFHVSGKVEASTEPQDMRLQRMLGNIPASLHPNPKSALVVGFGAGVTAGSLVSYPEVQRIVICEIEPLIPARIGPYFAYENNRVLDDRRTQLVIDDARHYVLTTSETFDIITSDPIHPWVKGAATLYTKEYFEMVKRHLKPGGVATQWVPLYESNADVVKSEMATFFEVFPNGAIWGNPSNGQGYDVVLSGQLDPLRVDVTALQDRLNQPAYAAVAVSLREVGLRSAEDLLATYAGSGADLQPWL